MGKRYLLEPGEVFNDLTVVGQVPKKTAQLRWLCRCECGQFTEVDSYDLRNGKTKSCGCKQHAGTHGMSRSPEFKAWSGMLQRCNNPYKTEYKYYGGRGISVCPEWHEFVAFYQDMGPRPSPTHSLDRINCNGNYEPGNVRWASAFEQWENREARQFSFNAYQDKTASTAIYPRDDKAMAVIYCTLGLSGEAGEVAGKVKKVIRDNGFELTADAREKICDEVADVLWYISQLCTELDVKMETLALANLAKLEDRRDRGVLGGSGDNR